MTPAVRGGEIAPVNELLSFDGLSNGGLLFVTVCAVAVFLGALLDLWWRLRRTEALASRALVARFSSLVMGVILLALLLVEWVARC